MRIRVGSSAGGCCSALLLLLVLWCGLAIDYSPALAEEKPVLKGKVSDREGKAVVGAMVFVYDSPYVKRSADFISAATDTDGLFRMVLPPGRDWLVARS